MDFANRLMKVAKGDIFPKSGTGHISLYPANILHNTKPY